MRKVFLDKLPTWDKKENNKGRINWFKAIDMSVNFIYDDIQGTMKIKDYEKGMHRLTVDYCGVDYYIYTSHLIKGNIGRVIGVISRDFKINIGTYMNGLIITNTDKRDRIRGKKIENQKWYKYTCNKCGWTEGWMVESNLLNGQGCSCCSSKVVVYGINSIHDTAPWMIDLGVDFEEAKKFMRRSGKKIKCVCPHCGETTYKKISTIYRCKSIGCVCGDGQSYISKYIYSTLKQLNVKFDTEVIYEWNKYINPNNNNKLTQSRIDFVIYHNSREIPLEADGGFHRTDNKMNGQTKEMSKYIDKQRDDNCLKYLGEETIRISDEGDIKENILNSKLAREFDLSNIDWNGCEEFALKNLVKEVCDYWNNKEEWETTKDLVNNFKLGMRTVMIYLKTGTKLGWCNYDGKKEISKVNKGITKFNPISVYKNGNFIIKFDSTTDLITNSMEILEIQLYRNGINRSVLTQKEYKGFTFKRTIN